MLSVWFTRSRRVSALRDARFFVYRPLAALVGGALSLVGHGGSGLIHCAVGCDGWVHQPTLLWFERWPVADYCLKSRRLVGVFLVPGEADLPVTGRVAPRWALIRWLSGGRVCANDCVSYTVSVLRSAGLDIPRTVVRPVDLFDLLRERGFEYEELE